MGNKFNFSDRESAAVLAALDLLRQVGTDGSMADEIGEDIWRNTHSLLTNNGTVDALEPGEIRELKHRIRSNMPEPTLFVAEGPVTAFVVCPSRGFVEATLDQNRMPPKDFPTVRGATFRELKEFCRQGYRPLVYQYDYSREAKPYRVYYAVSGKLPGQYIDPALHFVPGETHAFIRTLRADDLQEVYCQMQSEGWGNNGGVRFYIEALGAVEGVHHTSLSVGDVVITPEFETLMCKSIGWDEVPEDRQIPNIPDYPDC